MHEHAPRRVSCHGPCLGHLLGEAAWDSSLGRWHWPVDRCNHSHHSSSSLRRVLAASSVSSIKIVGDSVLRRFYFTLVAMLKGEGRGSLPPNPAHGKIDPRVAGVAWYDDLPPALKHVKQHLSEHVKTGSGSLLVSFDWSPDPSMLARTLASIDVAAWDSVIVNGGIWSLEHTFRSVSSTIGGGFWPGPVGSTLGQVNLARPFHIPFTVRRRFGDEITSVADAYAEALANFSHRTYQHCTTRLHPRNQTHNTRRRGCAFPKLFYLELGGIGFDQDRIKQSDFYYYNFIDAFLAPRWRDAIRARADDRWTLLPTQATLVANGNNCSHDFHGVHFLRQCRELYVHLFANALTTLQDHARRDREGGAVSAQGCSQSLESLRRTVFW